jgi:hypothetical protein
MFRRLRKIEGREENKNELKSNPRPRLPATTPAAAPRRSAAGRRSTRPAPPPPAAPGRRWLSHAAAPTHEAVRRKATGRTTGSSASRRATRRRQATRPLRSRPKALAEAHTSTARRMDSGEVSPTLPKNPKPEELPRGARTTASRRSRTDYDLKDLKIPKEDKDVVSGFVARLHAQNASNERGARGARGPTTPSRSARRRRAPRRTRAAHGVIDALNQEWGGKFRRYKGLVENVLTIFPRRCAMRSSRRAAGWHAIFNHPDVMRGFLALSLRDEPGRHRRSARRWRPRQVGMVDRYKEIQKVMRENRKAYNKDAGKQELDTQPDRRAEQERLIDKNGNLIKGKAA